MSKGAHMRLSISTVRPNALRACLTAILFSTMHVHAADRITPVDNRKHQNESVLHALSPVQMNVIRSVGRHILTAKRHSQDGVADNEQLAILREGIDRLISAEGSLSAQSVITLHAQDKNEQVATRNQNKLSRDTALNQARQLSQQLRSHHQFAKAMSEDQPAAEHTLSAGLPIGKQRAEMFEKWADKLDAALADDEGERLTKLQMLKAQLQSTDANQLIAPIEHGAPTLQAMPSDFIPSASPGYSNQ